MTIAGNLRTMNLGDIVQWLAASAKTGTLVVDGPDFTKKLFFRRGDVVAVTSDNPREYLGHYLVGWGLCTRDDIEEMIQVQMDESKMLGELLVQRALVSPEDLKAAVTMKTRETLYDLLLWDSGDFRFIETELPDRSFHEIPLGVTSFLFEGYRQRDERVRMADTIPDPSYIPIAIAITEELSDSETALVMQMDGRASIGDLALATRTPTFDVMALVYRCVQSGTMQVLPPRGEETLSNFIASPWKTTERKIIARLERGRFLDAFRIVDETVEHYRGDEGITEWAASMTAVIEEAMAAESTDGSDVLELGIELADLIKLDCDPAEGFVLSRITGLYSFDEILNQLPGDRLTNRVILHNLIRRGLIKTREATSVTRFQRSRT